MTDTRDFRPRGVTVTDVLHDIASGDLPPGGTVRCDNRRDLPKKQRVHTWQNLGTDGRNYNGGYTEGEVRACQACGTGQFHRVKEDS